MTVGAWKDTQALQGGPRPQGPLAAPTPPTAQGAEGATPGGCPTAVWCELSPAWPLPPKGLKGAPPLGQRLQLPQEPVPLEMEVKEGRHPEGVQCDSQQGHPC